MFYLTQRSITESIISLVVLASVSSSRNSIIVLPAAGSTVTKGGNVIVQLQRPNSLTGSTELVVAIGVSSCASSPCQPADEVRGTILYQGPFDPAMHEPSQPPYQNFTVTLPHLIAAGNGKINIAHASLVGAGPFPDLETLNRAVVVA